MLNNKDIAIRIELAKNPITPPDILCDLAKDKSLEVRLALASQKKLTGKYIDLEFESYQRGNYGLLLAYVLVDGKNINLDLVKQGLSPYYTKYGKSQRYHAEFRTAEKLARKEKLNIWGDPELKKNI